MHSTSAIIHNSKWCYELSPSTIICNEHFFCSPATPKHNYGVFAYI